MVLARLNRPNGEPVPGRSQPMRAHGRTRRRIKREAAGKMRYGDLRCRIVRKRAQELSAAVLRDSQDMVRVQTRSKDAIETAGAILFRGPGRVFEKGQIIERVDELGLP